MVDIVRLVGLTFSPILLGSLSGLVGGARTVWYERLQKPVFSPPSYLFGIVWPILYLLMGVAAYMVFGRDDEAHPQIQVVWWLYILQLLLNISFSPIMFRLKNLLLAAIVTTLTLIFATATTLYFGIVLKKWWSVGLMMPYIIWLLFANVLAWSFYTLNSTKKNVPKIKDS
jgi:tryptophan-rich sensory protein